MLITVFYDIVDKETGDLIEEYLYVDIEVTEEEYKRIDESCVADICERVLDVIYLRFAEDDEGNPCSFYDLRDELDFLVMYPLEVMADNTMPDVFPEDFFPGEDML